MNTKLIVPAVLISMIVACGKKDNGGGDDDDNATGTVSSGGSTSGADPIPTDVPSDSTGATASTTLRFGQATGGSALALQAPVTLDLGGGIVLSDARVNVASIKLKSSHEESEADKALRETEKAERKALKEEFKSQEDSLKAKKEAIKDDYKAQKEAAATDADRDALETKMEAQIKVVEEERATLNKDREDANATSEGERDNNLRWKGPYIYNLVNSTVTPEIPAVDLIDGSYRRIEFKIKPNRMLTGLDPLLNNSIYVAGTVTVGGVATSFTASFPLEEEFKLRGLDGIKVEPGMANFLTVAFNAASWFTGIDMSTAEKDTAGVVVINDESNKLIWDVIRKNVKGSTKFGKDDDDDGKLGSTEAKGDGQDAANEIEVE